MIFQRTKIAEQLFNEKSSNRIKLVNLIVEVLKRNKIGTTEQKQRIDYTSDELETLKKIASFALFIESNECPNFRTADETEKLIESLLVSIKKNKPLLLFALFCPSYKKSKEVVGFNREIGETTKKGINNLEVLSKKATSLGINNEVYAIYSDLVLENFEKLNKSDFQDLEENFLSFTEYGRTINPLINFVKISQIGKCSELIGLNGTKIPQTKLSNKKLQTIANRSKPFYKEILGWKDSDILERTKVLANSCSIMGQEIRKINPQAIMIMTENIYERGIFYYSENLENPLPIFYPHKTETKIDLIKIL